MEKSNRKIKRPTTLAIDIGGSIIKMIIMDAKTKPLTPYLRMSTPRPATVAAIFKLLKQMIDHFHLPYDRVSAGFPGVVKQGIIKTAVNMHPSWVNLHFQQKLAELTHHKVRVANDADVQGYGDIKGKGVELVITLGTGVGSALFLDGKLLPNLELGHHPFKDNATYEALLGKAALEKWGKRKWQAHLKAAITLWQKTFNCDQLYLGGGFAHEIKFKLPTGVFLSDNINGVLGGIKLWEPSSSS